VLTRASPPCRTQSQYRAVGDAAAETAEAHMRERLAHFKSCLEAFALKHRCAALLIRAALSARASLIRSRARHTRSAEIRADPAFRAQFHAMCASTGVDPLASNKGAWAQLLGFGDFYYELGVQIGKPYHLLAARVEALARCADARVCVCVCVCACSQLRLAWPRARTPAA
jgi:ESCRT-II complex subunit VPS22